MPDFEVRNSEVEALLKEIGTLLKHAVAQVPGYGFCLWIFSYGEGGELFYTSSAQRDDVMKMIDEFRGKGKL